MKDKLLSLKKSSFTECSQEKEYDKWLELRTTGIGGSDAGAILGYNKYASSLTIYMAKKGHNTFKGNTATEWGHILEAPIREKMAKELNLQVETVEGMFTSVEYPFMNANLDGLCIADNVLIGGEVVDGLGGIEIKTSSKGDGFGEEEIPDSYYCQVQHYMVVTGLSWFVLTVFIFSTKTAKHYVIRKNDDFIQNELIPKEKTFWNEYVLKDIIPAPNGASNESEIMKSLPMDEIIDIQDKEVISLVEEELSLDKEIKELTKKQSELKNQILYKLCEHSSKLENVDKTTATIGNYKITYNKQVRKTIDTDNLKKDGLYDKYSKDNVSKVLRISEVKTEEKGE